ncbi:MAG: NAD(+) diphosphatase [Firmicutes bacterium]|nr:NAD(+) diphosphatase [Bacillota bacterium]
MIQDIAPHVFHNEYTPRPLKDLDAIVCYDGNKVLMDITAGEDKAIFPQLNDFTPEQQQRIRESRRLQYLFAIDEIGYILVPMDRIFNPGTEPVDSDWTGATGNTLRFLHIQKVRQQSDNCVGHAMMVSYHLSDWMNKHCFCGRCGSMTVPHAKERAMYCESCGNIIYPQISPAVAVAVVDPKTDRILLAKGLGEFKKFALIAGYVEIGETIEDCVRREVMEEVGLKVGKLHYFKSQPWGLTGIEMMGFYAELDGDDTVTIQETELAEARWFDRSELKEEPTMSLSFTLIDTFRRGEYVNWLK